jgi:hypothetical protein
MTRVEVTFVGGPLDGREVSIAAAELLEAQHVIEPESGAVYSLQAEQLPVGEFELVYLAHGAPKRRRQQRPRPHPRLLAMLASCYLTFLRLGFGHGGASEATGVPYGRWLEQRQSDGAFNIACQIAVEHGRRLKAEGRSAHTVAGTRRETQR